MSGVPLRSGPRRTAFVEGRCNKTGQRLGPATQPHQRQLTVVPMASAAPALTSSGAPVQVSVACTFVGACIGAEAGPCQGILGQRRKNANNCRCSSLRLQHCLLQAYPTTPPGTASFRHPWETRHHLIPPYGSDPFLHPAPIRFACLTQTPDHFHTCSPALPVLSPKPCLPPMRSSTPACRHLSRSPPLTPLTCRTRCTASHRTSSCCTACAVRSGSSTRWSTA